jgi:hypothetical protein
MSKSSKAETAVPAGPKLSAGAMLLKDIAPSSIAEDMYVILDLKLVNFSYLDFKLLVKTTTPVHLIKRQLVERHGRMSELHLFKGGVSAETEMVNGSCAPLLAYKCVQRVMAISIALADAYTLAEYGVVGKKKSDNPDTLVIFYNFIPHAHSDALLLATHTRDRVGVSS